MLLLDVQKDFNSACHILLASNPEWRVPWTFVSNHEKYFLTLNKLCEQVTYFERGVNKKRKTAYNRSQLIAAHAELFVTLAIRQRDELMQSTASLRLSTAKRDAMKAVQDEGIIKEVDKTTGQVRNIL